MQNIKELSEGLHKGDRRSLSRAITVVENNIDGCEQLLESLRFTKKVPVVGITGPPGAGKSTLINSLIGTLLQQNQKVAVLAVDPTSPFTQGAILGDRLRMEDHFNDPNIFIRSLATRGTLGGLSAKSLEVTDLLKAAGFDWVIIETVGVGQTEVEIAALADTTVLVLVPEAGDEVQAMKSGIMEIADIFVVNKSDREGSGSFAKNIIESVSRHPKQQGWEIPVLKTTATSNEGVLQLLEKIKEHRQHHHADFDLLLLINKAYRLIQEKRMKGIDLETLRKELSLLCNNPSFNIYAFVSQRY